MLGSVLGLDMLVDTADLTPCPQGTDIAVGDTTPTVSAQVLGNSEGRWGMEEALSSPGKLSPSLSL